MVELEFVGGPFDGTSSELPEEILDANPIIGFSAEGSDEPGIFYEIKGGKAFFHGYENPFVGPSKKFLEVDVLDGKMSQKPEE